MVETSNIGRDVTTGATGATPVAPRFSDDLTLFNQNFPMILVENTAFNNFLVFCVKASKSKLQLIALVETQRVFSMLLLSTTAQLIERAGSTAAVAAGLSFG